MGLGTIMKELENLGFPRHQQQWLHAYPKQKNYTVTYKPYSVKLALKREMLTFRAVAQAKN